MFGSRLNRLGAPSKRPPFTPTRLFTDSEGFYNDIQTYSSTYFEDTAGTDTAELEDTIALILDQSQGLELGSEKITNNDFSDGTTGWTSVGTGSSFTASDGVATITRGSATTYFQAYFSTTIGATYKVNISRFGGTSSAATTRPRIDGTTLASPLLPNDTTTSFVFVAALATTSLGVTLSGSEGDTAEFDFISVRELPGNHLTQATAGARPLLTTDGGFTVLQFDEVDDALTATIPAITGGTLVLATRDGIWIDDDINASAGTFSVGPTTYTGGPDGLLSVIGNKLIGPPLLLDRQLSSSERNALIQWFVSRGAGNSVTFLKLIFDRAGSSILDRNDDPIRVRAA